MTFRDTVRTSEIISLTICAAVTIFFLVVRIMFMRDFVDLIVPISTVFSACLSVFLTLMAKGTYVLHDNHISIKSRLRKKTIPYSDIVKVTCTKHILRSLTSTRFRCVEIQFKDEAKPNMPPNFIHTIHASPTDIDMNEFVRLLENRLHA